MKKKSIINIVLIVTFLTVLMGCDLSLDEPPHDWMIGNWKGNMATNDTTLNITTSNIVINYDGQKIDLGVAGLFVNITEEAPNDNEYVITYKKSSDVIKFTFERIALSSTTMYLTIDDNGVSSGIEIYDKQ